MALSSLIVGIALAAAIQCANRVGEPSSVHAEVENTCHHKSSPASIEPEMVWVEGGTFTMGSSEDSDSPAHMVQLSSYWLGKYEITQAQWKAVMGTNPKCFNTCDQCPVEEVSWNEAHEFISKLNTQSGKNYRLPTEAEWEFAARGGNKSKNYSYAGSNAIDSVGWYGENSGQNTHPVGEKQANELGICDMTGNVFEWCADWYGEYGTDHSTDPKGPPSGERRVIRGGSWGNIEWICRSSFRSREFADNGYSSLGFRLALSPVQ